MTLRSITLRGVQFFANIFVTTILSETILDWLMVMGSIHEEEKEEEKKKKKNKIWWHYHFKRK